MRSAMLGLACAGLIHTGAIAGDYPDRTIHLVTSGIGGPADVISRLIAAGISPKLGQTVVVDNRVPLIAYDQVAKAAPDGYTLYVAGAYFPVLKLLQPTAVSADPLAGFTPIVQTEVTPLMVVVNPSLPVHSLQELIALIKQKPGTLNVATGAFGGAADLGARLLEANIGHDVINISYKDTAQALNGVISGYVQVMVEEVPALMPNVAAGKLRALAVTSAERVRQAPDVPTMAEAGVPGLEMWDFIGLYGPAKLPRPIVDRLNAAVVQAFQEPELQARLTSAGIEIQSGTPEQFEQMVQSSVTKWKQVLNDSNLKH